MFVPTNGRNPWRFCIYERYVTYQKIISQLHFSILMGMKRLPDPSYQHLDKGILNTVLLVKS